jgi:hypothetical protein
MDVKDNQHYVSKAYLDKFVHPTSKDKQLYPYLKDRGGKNPTGTRRLASADHFYVQHENGTTTNKLDEARQKSENLYFAGGNNASPLVKCALDDGFFPTASDKIIFAGAAALLRCGSLVQIHNAAMMALFAEQMELFNRLNTDDVMEKFKADFGDEADEKLQKARDSIWKGKVFAEVGEEHWKQLGFTSFHAEGPLPMRAWSAAGPSRRRGRFRWRIMGSSGGQIFS